MSNRDAMWELVKRLSGQQNVIAIPRVYRQMMGSWEGAAFLNQIIYWSDKGQDGTFAHTASEWETELDLSRYEVDKYSKVLKDAGVIRTEVRKFRGVPTVHYTLLIAEFQQWICEFFTNESVKNLQNDVQKIRKSYTEIITETSTDNIFGVADSPEQIEIPEITQSPAQPASPPVKAQKPSKEEQAAAKRAAKAAAAAAEAERLARLIFTVDDMLLVTTLAPAYAAKGWAPPTRFQNEMQQAKYRECASTLGYDDTKRAIERCLVQGRIGLDNIVSSMMSWVANRKAGPPRDPPTDNRSQPAAYGPLREFISETMGG